MLTTGVDIIHIPRVERAVSRYGARFLQRVFTPYELAYCRGRISELAARFAAKEAVSKALGVGMRILSPYGIGWHDAEVLNERSGKPIIRLHGRAASLANELHLAQWAISLTHEQEYAIAFVVAM
ncbi:MAG: holo-ACP synthase [Thermoflexales bacterium]|nr:holo-ACP synthase [Thermoflexales bacterium]MDW8350692.1 holo-ACP synthase [Anaerolineae bacterium]